LNKIISPNSVAGFLKGKGYSKISMERSRIRHFLIKSRLNGKNGKFILDTGASHTVVDEKAASKFGMKFVQKKSSKAAGLGTSELSVRLSKGNKLSLDSFLIENLKISVMDLSHVNRALSRFGAGKVEGVIGADILKKYKAIIDYNEEALYLLKKSFRGKFKN
jgi:hypothetical protein